MCMFMATKTITITRDSYNLLAANKLEDESFSKEIERLLKRRTSLKDFFGILGDEGNKMANDLQQIRAQQLRTLSSRAK